MASVSTSYCDILILTILLMVASCQGRGIPRHITTYIDEEYPTDNEYRGEDREEFLFSEASAQFSAQTGELTWSPVTSDYSIHTGSAFHESSTPMPTTTTADPSSTSVEPTATTLIPSTQSPSTVTKIPHPTTSTITSQPTRSSTRTTTTTAFPTTLTTELSTDSFTTEETTLSTEEGSTPAFTSESTWVT